MSEINPFGGIIDRAERTADRAVAGKWNGRGDAPSRAAALEWAIASGVPKADAERLITKGSPAEIAKAARTVVEMLGHDAITKATKDRGRWNGLLAPLMPGHRGPMRSAPDADLNGDKVVSRDEALAKGRAKLARTEAKAQQVDVHAGPPLPTPDRGAPLWPFVLDGMTDEEITGLVVATNRGQRIGARYYAADTIEPLKWSPERRADLQRLMHSIGLYGDTRVQLGHWSELDQTAYRLVLEQSNVSGTDWVETLAGWRRNPPTELLEEIRGERPRPRPTIQVESPVEIRQRAAVASRLLTGAVDRGFAEETVPGYQAAQVAAQTDVYADQDNGGGGTVTQAPSVEGYAEDQLRRQKPIEVDGYQFLGQFEEFLSMLGAQP